MRYRVIIQKAAEKFIRKQDKKTQERLLRACYALPDGTDIKKLQGVDLYRMRVGGFRIIYSADDCFMIISVEKINNRGDVYKRI